MKYSHVLQGDSRRDTVTRTDLVTIRDALALVLDGDGHCPIHQRWRATRNRMPRRQGEYVELWLDGGSMPFATMTTAEARALFDSATAALGPPVKVECVHCAMRLVVYRYRDAAAKTLTDHLREHHLDQQAGSAFSEVLEHFQFLLPW
jgi:hypothetical protein